MASRPSAEAGVSLVELLIALAITGIVVFGAITLVDNTEKGRVMLTAKTDAETQGNVFFETLLRYFRTRMTANSDNGFVVGPCAIPAPSSSCLDIIRRQRRGARETTERFRIKSACQELTVSELVTLRKLDLTKERVATSVKELCGFVCQPGRRPVIVVRHFLDEAMFPGKSRDHVLPEGRRFGEAYAATAGFCVRMDGSDEVRVRQGFSYIRPGDGALLKLVRKDASWPTTEDNSKIEWLP